MTKEEKIKQLLDAYEEQKMELDYKFSVKVKDIVPFPDEPETPEESAAHEKTLDEANEMYKQETKAIEDRFIRAIAALEG